MVRPRTTDFHPLALNPWNGGENSYDRALEAIEQSAATTPDRLLQENEELLMFAIDALSARIADHASANFTQYQHVVKEMAQRGKTPNARVIHGNASPHRSIHFLHRNELMESIELARLTHIGRRGIGPAVCEYVTGDSLLWRARLLGLRPTVLNEKPYFKLKQFSDRLPATVILDRKQDILSHYGGSELTTMRETFMLHSLNPSAPMPNELYDYLFSEYDNLASQKNVSSYNRVDPVIGELVEQAFQTDDETYVIDLSTTIYEHTIRGNGAA